MRILRDLQISRKSLEDWTDNLTWGKDGRIFLSTQSELTVCEPVFEKSVNKQLKNLFHVKEYHLPEPDNKFEGINFNQNSILMTQPEPVIQRCIPSPRSDYIAVMTKHANVLLYKNDQLIGQFDNPEDTLGSRAYHSVTWNDEGTILYTGNENNSINIYNVSADDKIQHRGILKLGDSPENKWITKMHFASGKILCLNTDNEVFLVDSISVSYTHLY